MCTEDRKPAQQKKTGSFGAESSSLLSLKFLIEVSTSINEVRGFRFQVFLLRLQLVYVLPFLCVYAVYHVPAPLAGTIFTTNI